MQMLTKTLVKLNKLTSPIFCSCNALNRKYSSENESAEKKLGAMGSKYKIFQEQDTEIILDVYEERLKYSDLLEDEEVDDNAFVGLNLQRGKEGVYDIEDLVQVLKRENSEDIFVARVPNEIKYVDYICITSGKSQRHMQAIAQFVRRVYKQKRHKNDTVPKLEGESSKDWMALDLGKYRYFGTGKIRCLKKRQAQTGLTFIMAHQCTSSKTVVTTYPNS